MAYLLYKYIRRRVKENKEKNAIPATADDSHLVPEPNQGQEPKSERQEAVSGDGLVDEHSVNPIIERR